MVLLLILTSCTEKIVTEYYVEGVSNPIINLNGDWKISLDLPNEFWKQTTLETDWRDVKVPGEVMMQGFSIKNDVPFAYKKEISIPVDFSGKHIYVQFDGVYGYARVWINGHYVREHHGGFTTWKCDVTPYVKAGEKAVLTIEVTDCADDISYASGYAKHQIGGILRDVNLVVLPTNYPEKIQIETDLDREYKDANLRISGKLKNKGVNSEIKVQLLDANTKEIALGKTSLLLNGEIDFYFENTISNPKKWDAEHPNLYTLRISYYENKELLWSKNHDFGFREVEVVGNSFKVNGKFVKLRGACRHDNHPTLGRVATPEYDLKDVLLAKEANMNYIRTSHYPPSDNFLKLCDEYGIYVEDETAVCFVIDYRIKGYEIAATSQSDAAYTERYLSQLQEMVGMHRNHPSVVIWSIGNESIYGSNFQKSFDWIQKNDATRPIMFSYPGTAPDSLAPYQILSMHYPGINGDLNQYGKKTTGFGFEEMPVIFDEWAHVAAYNNETIKEDPNIRDFWGQSLDKMWAKTFDADGGLGGAIWGMIDETFMLPENLDGFRDWWGINDNTVLPYQGTTVGYGEWGIVDIWRRKKPEFWNTKKAYSPIKITETTIKDYIKGAPIKIPVYNRFDHTNLNEITIKYSYEDEIGTVAGFELKPHTKGMLSLPIMEWDATKKIAVDFYNTNENLIDSYHIKQQVKEIVKSDVNISNTGGVTVTDNEHLLIVHTKIGDLYFDKNTGMLTEMENGNEKIKVSGPVMTYKTKGEKLTYSSSEINNYSKNWKLDKFSHKKEKEKVVVSLQGNYDKIKVLFELFVFENGEITTTFSYKNLPKEYVREIGVKYNFDSDFDALSWEREGYWSRYPKTHLSATIGEEIPLYSKKANAYRAVPEKSWNEDTKSFYYEGTAIEKIKELTYVAKATKENVRTYSLLKDSKTYVSVQGKGKVSCRLAKNNNSLDLFINTEVDYIDLNWGNYQRNILVGSNYKGEVTFFLNENEKSK